MSTQGRDDLSATLRSLRKDAGLSGQKAAQQSGLSQSKISRFENGVLMPTADEVDALCRLYRARADTRRSLIRVARDIREESTSARVVLQRGAWRLQQRIGRIEAASARIRSFNPSFMIGLLQTRPYIRAMFDDVADDDEELEQTVEARVERQELLQTGREFTLLMTEGALRFNLGSDSVMREQLEHVEEATHLTNVHVGIISQTTPATIPPLHGFHIYDSRAVILGTLTATAVITDSRDVRDYEKHFTELEELASFGADARAVIHRVAHDFSELS